MTVAPFEPCVRCGRGDVTTGFALEGKPEWIVDIISELGISKQRARELVAEDDPYGKMHAMVSIDTRSGDTALAIPLRLCRECAGKFDIQIGNVPKLPVARQSAVEAGEGTEGEAPR